MTALIVQPRAVRDLDEIEAYSFEEYGFEVAISYMDKIKPVLDRLLDFPQSGPVYPDIVPAVRHVRAGQHFIFYDYDGTTISVVRVLHTSRAPAGMI